MMQIVIKHDIESGGSNEIYLVRWGRIPSLLSEHAEIFILRFSTANVQSGDKQ
jgi:hypothetical protein